MACAKREGTSLLFRYLAGTFLLRAGAVLGILLLLFLAVDALEGSGRMSGEPWLPVAPGRFFFALVWLMPLGATLGATLTVGRLLSTGEWHAIGGSGISSALLLRVATAILLPGALVHAGVVHFVAPVVAAGTGPDAVLQMSANSYQRWDEHLVIHGPAEVTIIERRAGRPLSMVRIDGDGASDAVRWDKVDGFVSVPVQEVPPPVALPTPAADGFYGGELHSAALWQMARHLQRAGVPADPLWAEFFLRIALVFSCWLLPVIGGVLCFVFRWKTPFAPVAVGLLVCATYWLLSATGWVMAGAGMIAPWLVAVSGNVPGIGVLGGGLLATRLPR